MVVYVDSEPHAMMAFERCDWWDGGDGRWLVTCQIDASLLEKCGIPDGIYSP